MTHIRESGATLLVTLRYNERQRLAQRTNNATSNPSGSTLTYDGLSRPATLAHDLGGTTRDVTWTYGWNPASGLASIARDNDAFAYPTFGQTRAYTTNGLNQYIQVGSTAHGYDANGNLTMTARPPTPTTSRTASCRPWAPRMRRSPTIRWEDCGGWRRGS